MSLTAGFFEHVARLAFSKRIDLSYLEEKEVIQPKFYFEKDGTREVLARYDALLERFGPDPRLRLPHPKRFGIDLPKSSFFDHYYGFMERSFPLMGPTLADYNYWRNEMPPWKRPMEDFKDFHRLIDAYEERFQKYGADPTIKLPKPPGNFTYYSLGGVSRNDLFEGLMAKSVGDTLADYAKYREIRAAKERGEWVPSMLNLLGHAEGWTRKRERNGKTVIEIRDTPPPPKRPKKKTGKSPTPRAPKSKSGKTSKLRTPKP